VVSLVVFWGADVLERSLRERWWYDSDTGPISIFGWQTRWVTRETLLEGLDTRDCTPTLMAGSMTHRSYAVCAGFSRSRTARTVSRAPGRVSSAQ
jgi:hypothetical protein